MAQQPDGKPASTERVTFTRPAAQRIARVVRTVESGDRSQKGLSFQRSSPIANVKQVRAATFTGSWFTGSIKTVTLENQPTATVSVQNLTISLPFTATQSCIVGRDGTSWYLVSALDEQVKRGTFAAPWTKATSKTVSLLTGQQVNVVNDYVTISGSGTKKCTVARDGITWHLIAAECS